MTYAQCFPEPPVLTAEQSQLLADQVIGQEHPGTILKDFQTVLDFVGPQGAPSCGKHNLLPMKSLGELNSRMSRPVELCLKRPQQRSYAYLHALYLLLRATGLAQVRGQGTKARLAWDAGVMESWRGLNATERYFCLLEAWLRQGRTAMLGEEGYRHERGFLVNCLMAWRGITERPKRMSGERAENRYLHGIGTDYFHVALMDLFGLMAVEHGRPAKGETWCPASIRRLPYGDAVFTLLTSLPLFEEPEEPAEVGNVTFGRWQGLFQPYFPQWRNNLVLPEVESRSGLFVFKASLGSVWRRIGIPDGMTLDDLAYSIVSAFDFDMDHLYSFTYRNRLGVPVQIDDPRCAEGPCTLDVHINQLAMRVGDTMTFLYDFGDNWEFAVRLDRIDPLEAGTDKPVILDAKGDPPRQYGGWDDEDWDESDPEDADLDD